MRYVALVTVLVTLALPAEPQSDHCVCLAPTIKPTGDQAADTHGALAAYNEWFREPTPTNLQKARGRFITASAELLLKYGLPSVDASYLFDEARYAPSDEKRFASVSERILTMAIARGVLCEVTFTTPQEGAVINYQTLGERVRNEPPHTLPATTNCLTKLPIGSYLIWSSRDAKATSDKNREIPIVNVTESVHLQERK